jgi:hypothetical protein
MLLAAMRVERVVQGDANVNLTGRERTTRIWILG